MLYDLTVIVDAHVDVDDTAAASWTWPTFDDVDDSRRDMYGARQTTRVLDVFHPSHPSHRYVSTPGAYIVFRYSAVYGGPRTYRGVRGPDERLNVRPDSATSRRSFADRYAVSVHRTAYVAPTFPPIRRIALHVATDDASVVHVNRFRKSSQWSARGGACLNCMPRAIRRLTNAPPPCSRSGCHGAAAGRCGDHDGLADVDDDTSCRSSTFWTRRKICRLRCYRLRLRSDYIYFKSN
jgi:hypothetical protein